MSVSNIDTFVLSFSDPSLSSDNPERARVSSNYSFELLNNNNVRTLSTNGAQNGDDVEGLLYVPTLAAGDACLNRSARYIPPNATRWANLPPAEDPYNAIAFAPWISIECAAAFLNAASPSSDAFLTYLPDNATEIPPPLGSSAWTLNDGGVPWSQLKFPVYAIPGANGFSIMQQMVLYSGSLSSAPNANILRQQFAPTDYVRLYSIFNTGSADHYPTLWAFLLIILGLVLLLVGMTSCTMHYRQRRARTRLRQRVLAGEVNLESLGLTRPPRLTQSDIDALPQIIYTPSEEKHSLSLDKLPPPSKSTDPAMASPQDYNQPTCPICLEDYIPGTTTVRTLPCHHIYHPACIDPHLLSSASLCPVCKARVVSQEERATANGSNPNHVTGPVITNAMVRRERYIRMLRRRQAVGFPPDTRTSWIQRRFGRLVVPVVGRGMRAGTMPPPSRRTMWGNATAATLPVEPPITSQIEMGIVVPIPHAEPPPPSSAAPTAPIMIGAASIQTPALPRPPAEDTEGRREWARRRASALLHRQSGMPSPATGTVDIEEAERQRIAGLPRWRKVAGGVFPALRN